ncbi:zinc finger and BTB domain-containing protein 32 isoform X2 [Phascolarctos cinereus]
MCYRLHGEKQRTLVDIAGVTNPRGGYLQSRRLVPVGVISPSELQGTHFSFCYIFVHVMLTMCVLQGSVLCPLFSSLYSHLTQPHCKGTPSPGPGARRTSLTLEASCCCLQGSLQLGTALPSSNEKKISDQRSSEGEKPFSCHLCPQCSQDISAMTKHLRTHGPAPHCCPLCQAGSPSVAATQAHIRSHPPGQLPGWTMQSTFLSSSSRPPLPPLLGPPENRILQPL